MILSTPVSHHTGSATYLPNRISDHLPLSRRLSNSDYRSKHGGHRDTAAPSLPPPRQVCQQSHHAPHTSPPSRAAVAAALRQTRRTRPTRSVSGVSGTKQRGSGCIIDELWELPPWCHSGWRTTTAAPAPVMPRWRM